MMMTTITFLDVCMLFVAGFFGQKIALRLHVWLQRKAMTRRWLRRLL